MRQLSDGITALLGFTALVLINLAIAGSSLGVVKQHCLDVESSIQAESADVDSSWTYILWPPLFFANADPMDKVCVRNSPVREALGASGVWELGTPEEQLRLRVEDVLEAQSD